MKPGDVNTAFIIYPLTEKQKAERLSKMPKPGESAYFTTQQKIAPFRTRDIHGNKIDLKELQGKVVVLNFWFINCAPCRTEIPGLNKLVDSFRTSGSVEFIGLALDDKNSLEKFLENNPFHYSIVDGARFISDKYGIRSYPTHVVLDQQGKVYFHSTGLAPNTVQWLYKSINELLPVDETKTAAK